MNCLELAGPDNDLQTLPLVCPVNAPSLACLAIRQAYAGISVTSTNAKRELGPGQEDDAACPRAFVTTHWSVVLKAAASDTTRSRAALATLCESYWFPLYAHARRRGYSPHDAEDATQGFFARLLERHAFAAAAPERGRFRSFLLTAMGNYLATEWKKEQTLKRGGGVGMLSLDMTDAESRYGFGPADGASPDKAFDRNWALQVLELVLKRLENECTVQSQGEVFAALKHTLLGTRESQPYAQLATQLGMTEGGVKVAVHRLRRRYRDLIREQIAETVDSPEAVESELRHLRQALRGG